MSFDNLPVVVCLFSLIDRDNFCMKTSPRIISHRWLTLLLLICSVSVFVAGSPVATVARDRFMFKSLADLDKCVDRYDSDICLEVLQQYAKAHPKELFEIGKRARLQFKHWVALQFFEPALGASKSATKCADEDVRLAIVSGLSLPTDDAPSAIARRLLSGKCFASVRTMIEKEIASANREGYLPQHACPIFTTKGVKIDACEPKKAIAATPVIEEKLPIVDIATAKLGIVKVYSGSEGERIAIVDVVGSPGTYLVRIDGVRSPINGKTMIHKEQQSGNGSIYWTEIDGKRWNTIFVRRSSYKNYTVNVPGLRDEIDMNYNDGASKATSAGSFRK
jgi:hypothetical protein